MLALLFTLVLSFPMYFLQCKAGVCFADINHSTKKCKGFLYGNLSVAECCSRGGAYYTLENVTYGTVFRFEISDGQRKGATKPNNKGLVNYDCYSCEDWKNSLKPVTCENKKCSHGRVCKMVNNNARCVCPITSCKANNSFQVCSNLNKTYQSECHLKMHTCQRGREEKVMYNGSCQASCSQVHCNDNKQCIQDTSNVIHCVHCNNKPCNDPISNETIVCGLNNATYPSACHLRKATCKLGKNIGIAYVGHCRDVANCNNITCTSGQRCIMDDKNPLCIDCTKSCRHSTRKPFRYKGSNVCGSDGVTYRSFCDLQKHVCLKNVDINVVKYGSCKGKISSRKLFSVKDLRSLRRKTISLGQLLRIASRIGFPLTVRGNAPKGIWRKKVRVNTLLHHMLRLVIKRKI